MPKKTKKEKIIAEYRRKHEPHPDTAISFQYQLNTPAFVPSQQAQSVDTTEFHEIRRDLAKTLILAVISIAIELVFYRMS